MQNKFYLLLTQIGSLKKSRKNPLNVHVFPSAQIQKKFFSKKTF